MSAASPPQPSSTGSDWTRLARWTAFVLALVYAAGATTWAFWYPDRPAAPPSAELGPPTLRPPPMPAPRPIAHRPLPAGKAPAPMAPKPGTRGAAAPVRSVRLPHGIPRERGER